MTTEAPVGPEVVQAPLLRTLGLARPTGKHLLLATLLGAGAIGADIGLIGTAAWLISRASQHPNESHLAVAIVGVQFFGLSRGIFRYEERIVGHDTAFRLLASIRVLVYQKLERLAPTGLPAFRRGDLLARMVHDVDSLQDLVIRVIPPFVMAVLVGVLTVTLMWWMLPAAGIILAVALLLGATVVPWLTGLLARHKESQFAHRRGDLTAAMVDLTDGSAELIAFGGMGAQVERVRSLDAELTTIGAASAGTAGIGLALTTALAGLACWGCLVAGIPAVDAGRLSPELLAVITLVPLAAIEIVVGLPVATQALQKVRLAAARVFEVMDAPVAVTEPSAPLDLPAGPYTVACRSLSVRYPASTTDAVRDVDLLLSPGKRIAVVGSSGAGKSTLAAALLGFMPKTSGAVALNGTPIDQLTGEDLRTVVGLVGQDAFLFNTSIAENLRLGQRQATDHELRDMLERVGLGEWFHHLPHGLATEVGQFGARLSGGQRQRISVARAILADFPLLIADEPAEHLELSAADSLIEDLLEVTEGRSLLLITHRLHGLETLDEIVVMDHGQIVERGTHDELLAGSLRYSSLWSEEVRNGP